MQAIYEYFLIFIYYNNIDVKYPETDYHSHVISEFILFELVDKKNCRIVSIPAVYE